MINRDYHMHTVYCDGSNTAEEMVLAAIDRGMTEVGISGHSHTAFDESYCMSHEQTEQYRQELLALREKYKDQISIRIGLEVDRYSDADTAGFDYTIGSVHYIRVPDPGAKAGAADAKDGTVDVPEIPAGCLPYTEDGQDWIYIPVDETAEITKAAADAYFGGDLIAFAERYFETAGEVAGATGCDIIGHFDLLTKFNEPWLKDPGAAPAPGTVPASGTAPAPGAGPASGTAPADDAASDPAPALFDTGDPRYIRAWQKAADQLLQADVPFEINTGAMSKGYRSAPYPAKPIRDYIRSRGGRFILSSDSHRTETLCYQFDRSESELVVPIPVI